MEKYRKDKLAIQIDKRLSAKQKQEIIKCLKHFFPNKICLIALNSEDKWYEKKDLIKYE